MLVGRRTGDREDGSAGAEKKSQGDGSPGSKKGARRTVPLAPRPPGSIERAAPAGAALCAYVLFPPDSELVLLQQIVLQVPEFL